MILPRPAAARGHADHGWLKTAHTFSFADYYDPEEMGWSVLRVINDDWISPASGFGRHGHRDMEIVTYLLSGSLAHGDSMQNATTFRRPEVQRMSAGRGVMHSEFNPSEAEATHLLQIWITPDVQGIAPEYDQKRFEDADKRGKWLPIATSDGRLGSMTIHQDAGIYATLLSAGEAVLHVPAPGRRAYVHVASGDVALNGVPLATGDGARIESEAELMLAARGDSEVLLFDLP
jgi:redox-sensitive bicupin YhaK (pirin superfamily)